MLDILSTTRLRPNPSENDERRKRGSMGKDSRTPIESDLGRVIFSPAARRLHDKTQVFPLTTDDNIHSRLTHSLEVMNLAHSFALFLSGCKVFCDKIDRNVDDIMLLRDLEAVLSTICITHDIGNPPFGHFGESAIQQYFTDLFNSMERDLVRYDNHDTCQSTILLHLQNENDGISKVRDFLNNKDTLRDYTEFDGNAEGFRVLSKLQYLNDLYGMNLTCASLASYLKYPNCGPLDDRNGINIAKHKHGVFTTEKERMKAAMKNCGISREDSNSFYRHPFSFLMEAADSICYLCMDIEDACSKEWINYNSIVSAIDTNKNSAWKKITDKVNDQLPDAPDERKIVQLRSEIMSYFLTIACDNFEKNIDAIFDGNYNNELIKDDENKIAKELGKFCVKDIFSKREIQSLEITGNAVIKGIMDTYLNLLFHPQKSFRNRGKNLISKGIVMAVIQEHYEATREEKKAYDNINSFDVGELTIEERFRIIRDYVAGMTDNFALSHYQKLSGQKI